MIENDRMTMAHSLAARVPFTDVDMVQFLSTMPVAYKLKGLWKKHRLRSTGHLPDAVLRKEKVDLEMTYNRSPREAASH